VSTPTPAPPCSDLVIASNRLPFTVTLDGEGELSFEPSAGGLVSALQGIRESAAWVGWPGGVLPVEAEAGVAAGAAERGCVPVFLDEGEQEAFYGRICNDTIWPLFHYFADRMRFTREAWGVYEAVNERFAEAIEGVAADHARVWVHDFHLALVPRLLRARRPDLAIGFFLHIPFPSSEIYRLFPARAEVLRGMLGADYVGFHTGDYARHFRSSCLRVLGIEPGPDTVEFDDRTIGVGVHPIGIDVESFRQTLRDPATRPVEDELAERYAGLQLVLGIERLDYTKGIPQKLDAFERMLEREPELADSVTMLQVLVPSRLESAEYRAKRDEIEVRIAHINGRFGRLGHSPVAYVHRPVSPSELVALYRLADVMMVTPLRDGMNLVAQEFVLCQTDDPGGGASRRGALLLSEFAGAAYVLPGAVLVNPWDMDELADRLVEALALDSAERRRRLDLMANRVEQLDSARWAQGFLDRLGRFARAQPRPARPLDGRARETLAALFAGDRRRTFLLDYDGTLRELVGHPDLAVPTPEIRDLLRDLAALPHTDVHVVSGRTRESLDAWLGDLPISLCAEHGYLVRPAFGEWEAPLDVDLSWLPRAERLFRRVAADVPGTMVERKTASVSWHYRQAEPEYGAWRARELLVALENMLAGISAEVLPGRRVIEVRARGVNKGVYLETLLAARGGRQARIFAAGDDVTDNDVFRVLPRGSIAIHVGGFRPGSRRRPLEHEYVVETPAGLRSALRELADRLRATPASELGERAAAHRTKTRR
jgi:trehalose 6-phosphate synthase/phosphatase